MISPPLITFLVATCEIRSDEQGNYGQFEATHKSIQIDTQNPHGNTSQPSTRRLGLASGAVPPSTSARRFARQVALDEHPTYIEGEVVRRKKQTAKWLNATSVGCLLAKNCHQCFFCWLEGVNKT